MKTGLTLLCAAAACASFSQTLVAKSFASGFSSPMGYVQSPAHADYGYVLELGGTVKLVINGVTQPTPVLNLSGQVSTAGEGGLLGMALDPSFKTTGKFYVNVTTDNTSKTHIWQFTMAGDGKTAAAASKVNILTIDQPYQNHNGGAIHFGPDGYLYIGMGDGGGANDQDRRAQDPTQYLGKFLRIDPSHDDYPSDPDRNYAIPHSNPFFGADAYGLLDEVWSIGVRNPFRWSFDSVTGAMVIGDVGQDAYEEIDYEPSGKGGRNYGWSQREGRHDTGLPGSLLIKKTYDPFIEVPHPKSEAIIGGIVYRGKALGSSYYGRYFFGDWANGKIWSAPIQLDEAGEAKAADSGVVDHTSTISASLVGAVANPVSFDPDANGEVVVSDIGSGRLYRLALPNKVFFASSVNMTYGGGFSGDLKSLTSVDGSYYQIASKVAAGYGETASFGAKFTLDRVSNQFSSLKLRLVMGSASNAMVDVFAYNYVSGKYESIATYAGTAGVTSRLVDLDVNGQYFRNGKELTLLVRDRRSTGAFMLKVDQIAVLSEG